jgi:hypothetical protein
MKRFRVACAVVVFAGGCGGGARVPISRGTGPHPVLPEPNHAGPVGVAVGACGGLLVGDDDGNTVWRVRAARPRS